MEIIHIATIVLFLHVPFTLYFAIRYGGFR